MDFYGTLGPGCVKSHILDGMYREGMTGVRLNLSHGTLKENRNTICLARNAALRAGRAGKLLIDLQGPELRVGDFAGVKTLRADSSVIFGFRGIPVPLRLIEARS